MHGTEGGHPESDREPRRAQPGMGNAREGIQSPSQPTSPLRFTGWVQKGMEEGSAAPRSGADRLKSSAGVHPTILPANSAILNAATNDSQERSNPPAPLGSEQPVGRMTPGGRIGPEANARGKATGYADGATRG